MRRVQKREYLAALPFPVLCAVVACSGFAELPSEPGGLPPGSDGGTLAGGSGPVAGMGGVSGSDMPAGSMNSAGTGGGGSRGIVVEEPVKECPVITCASLGYACGYIRDECGTIIDCANEGLSCGALEACTGGVEGPTVCVTSLGEDCTACAGVPDCTGAGQPTVLTGRVITAGRDDANAANQLGVPNAFVYILRTADEMDLPAITSGIPEGGTSCDRCEDQDLGPLLVGALTDATGKFTLEGNIPVGMEFVLVVKAGRFRRAVRFTLPESAACTTTTLPTTLPENPTRLPRTMTDGLAVNIPHIAVTTGEADAMECVLHKMGIATGEFANPGADGMAPQRVHLYRGGGAPSGAGGTGPGGMQGPSGARIDDQTPHDRELYTSLPRLQSYDVVIADCEGGRYDSSGTDRAAGGDFVREYVNRGGRLFASHLEFTWLHDNGDATYDAADPIATGLAAAAEWTTTADSSSTVGTGSVSVGRPQASPRIQNFADWMVNEGVTQPGDNTFTILEPRSQNASLGANAEEFVYETELPTNAPMSLTNPRVEQFSVNTPYGAPAEAVCGRVAYSGFHVTAAQASGSGGMGGMPGGVVPVSPNADVIFPEHCKGDLSAQEKVLLYMLFDLNACVGEVPPPPECTPETCVSQGAECGFSNDGCGTPLDCGPCPVLPPR